MQMKHVIAILIMMMTQSTPHVTQQEFDLDNSGIQNTLSVRVRVTDPLGVGEGHYDDTDITINVLDVNDNPPAFDVNYISENLTEDDPVGTMVAQLSAADRDGAGPISEFELVISLVFEFDSISPFTLNIAFFTSIDL